MRTAAETAPLRMVIVGLALLVIIASGCSRFAGARQVRNLTWGRIALPAGVEASSLAVTTAGLLVGGRASSGGDHPVLYVVDASSAVRPVPLHPHSPYAKVADIVSVAVAGDHVVGLGVAHGGAHANFRWTVWSGSTNGLVEYPQTFETFGDQSAGGLLDIVFSSAGPVIAGTWVAREGGLDGAVWLARGHRWIRQSSAGTALANTPQLRVAPRAASGGGTMIISGSLITSDNGVHQQAAIWIQTSPDASWMLLELPDAGNSSEALSSACGARCWVAGYADASSSGAGVAALWSFYATDGPATRSRESALSRVKHDAEDANPVVVLWNGEPTLLVSHAGMTRQLVSDDQAWRTFTGPAGPVIDARTIDDRLYAIIRTADGVELWTTDLAATRTR
jgi:hypothetical protein